MPTTYYPFAQTADRFVQVAVRKDGCIQVIKRERKKNGIWPAAAPVPPPFLTPVNQAQPIEFTLAADGNFWATASLQQPEWDPYGYSSSYILGKPGTWPDQFNAPTELDCGTGHRNPNPPSYTQSLLCKVSGSILEFSDPQAPAGSQKNIVDTSKWYSQHNENRALLVLRVCGQNKGTVTFKNVQLPGGSNQVVV